MTIKEVFTNIGSVLLGAFILFAFLFVLGLFFWGAAEIAEITLPWLMLVSAIVITFDVLILAPLAAIPASRQFAGLLLYILSYITGLTSWLMGLLLAWTLWGFCAVVGGLLLAGIGVIPIGFFAAIFHGMWLESATLFILASVTLVSRAVGMSIAEIDQVY